MSSFWHKQLNKNLWNKTRSTRMSWFESWCLNIEESRLIAGSCQCCPNNWIRNEACRRKKMREKLRGKIPRCLERIYSLTMQQEELLIKSYSSNQPTKLQASFSSDLICGEKLDFDQRCQKVLASNSESGNIPDIVGDHMECWWGVHLCSSFLDQPNRESSCVTHVFF